MKNDFQSETTKNYLGTNVTIQIDRPMDSRHPEWNFIYPVNYGDIPGTKAPDGKELDAYLLGVFEQVKYFNGICIAILHRINASDDKLVVVPEGANYNDLQIRALTEFQERFWH